MSTEERLQPYETVRTCGGCGGRFAERAGTHILDRGKCPRCNPASKARMLDDRQDDFVPKDEGRPEGRPPNSIAGDTSVAPTSIHDDLPTCPKCGCVIGVPEPCTVCKLRAEGEKAATERIATFAEQEANRLERRGDDYGTLAAVALDNFAHALRAGRQEGES